MKFQLKQLTIFVLGIFLGIIETYGNTNPLSLVNLVDGKTVTISLQDQPTINVYFFTSQSCPCSKAHLNYLSELSKEFKQVKFYGVHVEKNTNYTIAHDFYANQKLNFPILLDAKFAFADLLKAIKTPQAFIILPSGELGFQGGITNSTNPDKAQKFYLKDALRALTTGKKPEVTDAKTFGCYINR